MDKKKLTLSTTDKKLTGLCAGIAEYFDMDPAVARLGYAFLCLITGFIPGILFYVIASFCIPKKQE